MTNSLRTILKEIFPGTIFLEDHFSAYLSHTHYRRKSVEKTRIIYFISIFRDNRKINKQHEWNSKQFINQSRKVSPQARIHNFNVTKAVQVVRNPPPRRRNKNKKTSVTFSRSHKSSNKKKNNCNDHGSYKNQHLQKTNKTKKKKKKIQINEKRNLNVKQKVRTIIISTFYLFLFINIILVLRFSFYHRVIFDLRGAGIFEPKFIDKARRLRSTRFFFFSPFCLITFIKIYLCTGMFMRVLLFFFSFTCRFRPRSLSRQKKKIYIY